MLVILIVLFILSFYFLIRRYKRYGDILFADYNVYTVLFSALYVLLPNIWYIFSRVSLFTDNENLIEQVAYYGIYFHVCLLLGMRFSPIVKDTINLSGCNKQVPVWNYFVLILILIYVLCIYSFYTPKIVEFNGDRKVLSAINTELIQVYKMAFVFFTLIFYSIFFSTTSKFRLKWIVLLLPFVLFDIASSGRYYIVMSLITYLVLRVRLSLKLDFKKILLLFLVLLFYRSLATEKFYWESVFGEFLFTMGNAHMVLEYDISSLNDYEAIFALFGRLLPLNLYSYFLDGWYESYLVQTSELNPLYAGLGGSVIAEALSLGKGAWIIYPWVIVMYSYIYRRLAWSDERLKLCFQIFSIICLWQIFRFSLIENLLYPFSLIILFGWPRILNNQRL